MKIVDAILDGVDSFLAWMSFSLKQPMEAYCDLETAESETNLVAHDGSLISVIQIQGCRGLMGEAEFERLHEGLQLCLHSAMSGPGHSLQVFFHYDRQTVGDSLGHMLSPARQTANRLSLSLDDLFQERIKYVGSYCADEQVFLVLWTRPQYLTAEENNYGMKDKLKLIREEKIPPLNRAQNIIAAIPQLRDSHESLVRSLLNDLQHLDVTSRLLNVHEALYYMRLSVDPDFTDPSWKPLLPGDDYRAVPEYEDAPKDFSDLLWPPLGKQLMPRDAEILDWKTVRIGDRVYASVFIDLFPKDIRTFVALFNRTLQTQIPWRISFFVDSDGLPSLKYKRAIAKVLAWSNQYNRLICDSASLLDYLHLNTDDVVVRLRVSASTWAPVDKLDVLRLRAAELAKAIQGWGGCDVSQVCGDPFAGAVSSMLGVSGNSVANASVASLSDVVYMLPVTRPSSPWAYGAVLFRTPDGKPWPFQPGSSLQTTWIDLVYARPGAGKSVLSNSLNLALCLSAGITRLPHIAIIDIGPSSSGLISLLREALPVNQRHLVAYHRLRMTPEFSVNPFDTLLGTRVPLQQDRSFLVNFLTLLATPIGHTQPYDGMADLAGLVIDELYKQFHDEGKPTTYSQNMEPLIDGLLEEIGFVRDQRTTWWEVTDALFNAGFEHEASLAQRYAMPLLADAASVVRQSAVEDLYGKITVPTGERLIDAFARMISAAIREYPILSRPTAFDLGMARVVSLDLDEVAKSGGEAADRQTAVMYMLARYVMARHFYLTEDCLTMIPDAYRHYHRERIDALREDPKRLVYDEFHRTSKARAVRDQVILDMREGRKWNVQIALLSQSIDDFDEVMIEFATSLYVMDAGTGQNVEKTAKLFGLSETAKVALRQRVHGPQASGATFLAQFSTKKGVNTQLLTCTLGPIELWSFSTTSEDARLRQLLYQKIGPVAARRLLARAFPSGSARSEIERRMNLLQEKAALIKEEDGSSVLQQLLEELLLMHREGAGR